MKNRFFSNTLSLPLLLLLAILLFSLTRCIQLNRQASQSPFVSHTQNDVFDTKEVAHTAKHFSEEHFNIKTHEQSLAVTLKQDQIIFPKQKTNSMILNVIDSLDPQQEDYLKDMQKQASSQKFSLVTIDRRIKSNHAFIHALSQRIEMAEQKGDFLSVLYKNKTYYQHFQVMLPIEMLNYEIKSIITQ